MTADESSKEEEEEGGGTNRTESSGCPNDSKGRDWDTASVPRASHPSAHPAFRVPWSRGQAGVNVPVWTETKTQGGETTQSRDSNTHPLLSVPGRSLLASEGGRPRTCRTKRHTGPRNRSRRSSPRGNGIYAFKSVSSSSDEGHFILMLTAERQNQVPFQVPLKSAVWVALNVEMRHP